MDLRWGLVGLGQVAEDYLAQAFAACRNGRLVACAGRTLERAEQFATAHGVDRAYPSYVELFRDPGVDAVFVAAPNHLHHAIVLAAANAGKHVLCEKPMALTTGEAEEMIAACRASGVTLRIGFQGRFHPSLAAAREIVRAGSLGEIREASVQRYVRIKILKWRNNLAEAGAGVLNDVAVHGIDFLQWILEDSIARVFAIARPPRSSGHTDDFVALTMEFVGGGVATLRCSRLLAYGANDVQIFGTRGMLVTSSLLRAAEKYPLVVTTEKGTERREFPAGDLYLAEIEAFADAVDGQATPACTGEEGLYLVRVSEAVVRSLETGAIQSVEV